jgi:tripartite-type tricarboxylate transporter receptor subunit TctC
MTRSPGFAPRRSTRIFAAVAMLLALSAAVPISDARAQATRTVKIVIPFAPGGGVDVVARVIAEQIGRMQGAKHNVAVVIENRPGAGTAIGTDAVLRANPDGNTLLMNNNSFAVIPHLRKLDYDALTSFESMCNIAATPTVVVVARQSPYRTLGDLIAAARARPGELTNGAAPGAVLSIMFEMLRQIAKVDVTFVPYPGTAPVIGAVLGGHVTAALVDYPVAAGQVQGGDLRALATGARERIGWMPDVPTIAESGYENFEASLWYGLFAPTKVPKDVIAELEGWFAEAARAPEVKVKLEPQGVTPVGTCGPEFASYVRAQFDVYGRVIRNSNFRTD